MLQLLSYIPLIYHPFPFFQSQVKLRQSQSPTESILIDDKVSVAHVPGIHHPSYALPICKPSLIAWQPYYGSCPAFPQVKLLFRTIVTFFHQ